MTSAELEKDLSFLFFFFLFLFFYIYMICTVRTHNLQIEGCVKHIALMLTLLALMVRYNVNSNVKHMLLYDAFD